MKNVPRYIATRLSNTENNDGAQMSRPAIKIAKLSMFIGLTVMMLSVAIILGFKQEVSSQVIGFGGHIQVSPYSSFFNDNKIDPIDIDSNILNQISTIDGIKRVQPIATTSSMIKTDDDFKGVILKGVDSLYDWNFFENNMVQGRTFASKVESTTIKNGAIISQVLSERLELKVGDQITMYFFKNSLRARKLTITGIYNTSFIEYDNTYVLTDATVVQRINNWETNQYSQIEVLIDDYKQLNNMADAIFLRIGNMFEDNHKTYNIQTIREIVPTMFEWLDMLDINTIVILVLMILVSGFCMISGLLIIIFERRETIGILKSLGANNTFIRKVFIWQSTKLISHSMLCGNIVGLAIIYVEWKWKLVPLDAASYYVNYVPVSIDIWIILLLNISVFIISVLMMIAPTYLATKISPVEAMRSE